MSLPTPDPVTQPFWDSLKAHAIKLQRCGGCQQFVFYPRAVCPACLSDDLVWTAVSGRGVIHAFTIPYRQAPEPYVVVLVELEEGVRMLSNLVGVEPKPEAVRIGSPVEIVYEDVDETITLPKFRPA
jgi:uncharacterized OB-fold protein